MTAHAFEHASTTEPEAILSHHDDAVGRAAGLGALGSAELYEHNRLSVLRVCRRFLRDPAEAEDAAQETFLAAHKALLAGAKPEHPLAWLATIARHTCWRRTQRRMREPLGLEYADDRVDPFSDVFEAAVQNDEREMLWQAVRELPAQQRNAFFLYEVVGHSYAEAASMLGVTDSALESLLVRARRRLRIRLQPLVAPAKAALVLPIGSPRSILRKLGVGSNGNAPATAAVAKLGTLPAVTKLVVTGGSMVILAATSSGIAIAEEPTAPNRMPLARRAHTFALKAHPGAGAASPVGRLAESDLKPARTVDTHVGTEQPQPRTPSNSDEGVPSVDQPTGGLGTAGQPQSQGRNGQSSIEQGGQSSAASGKSSDKSTKVNPGKSTAARSRAGAKSNAAEGKSKRHEAQPHPGNGTPANGRQAAHAPPTNQAPQTGGKADQSPGKGQGQTTTRARDQGQNQTAADAPTPPQQADAGTGQSNASGPPAQPPQAGNGHDAATAADPPGPPAQANSGANPAQSSTEHPAPAANAGAGHGK